MAGGLLFVGQGLLDTWAGQGKIDLKGNVMTLLQGAGKGRSYALEPAVRFLKILGADKDPHQLLAKVKQWSQLRELGAEQVSNSVIVGEVAYEVEPGFLAEAAALQAASTADLGEGARGKTVSPSAPLIGVPVSTARNPALAAAQTALPVQPSVPAGKPAAPATESSGGGFPPLPRELEEKRQEAEALARYLLENLSQ